MYQYFLNSHNNFRTLSKACKLAFKAQVCLARGDLYENLN